MLASRNPSKRYFASDPGLIRRRWWRRSGLELCFGRPSFAELPNLKGRRLQRKHALVAIILAQLDLICIASPHPDVYCP